MRKKKNSSLANLLKAEVCVGISSTLVGAFSGYCNAQGIPLENETIKLLHKGPLGIEGGLGALVGLAYFNDRLEHYNDSDLISNQFIGGSVTAGGAIGGAGVGVVKGAIEVSIGYGIGYLVGCAIK